MSVLPRIFNYRPSSSVDKEDCRISFGSSGPPSPGFTIVELLIVIVVIGILAAISIVAYNGIRQRTEDTQIRSAAAQLSKALTVWGLDTGLTIESQGVGHEGGGQGYLDFENSGHGYSKSITSVLVDQGYISKNFLENLPANKFVDATGSDRTMMLYRCSPGSSYKYVILYWLNDQTQGDLNSMYRARDECLVSIVPNYQGEPGTRNHRVSGMRGAIVF